MFNYNVIRYLRQNFNADETLSTSYAGNNEAIIALIRHKNSVNELDRHGRTALYLSSHCGHLETVRCLLNHGATVDQLVTTGEDKVIF